RPGTGVCRHPRQLRQRFVMIAENLPMHRTSSPPQCGGRLPRPLTAFALALVLALALALGQLAPPTVPAALALGLPEPAPPAELARPRGAGERYAPPFTLETLDGDHFSLADLRGR